MKTQARPADATAGPSAYDRAAGDPGADPRCIPIRLETPAPEGEAIVDPEHTAEEHETWAILMRRQKELLRGRACREYLEGLERMSFPRDRLPSLREAGRVLREVSGWEVARVPGLLHEADFFAFLSRRLFPSTDYIRPRSELDYTPAPDMFHDVFGHMPLITHREFADFYQRMGQAGVRARGADRRRMERFYWFTVEFGLIDTPAGIRIYGNGLLSSGGESQHCLTDAVEKLPFDPGQLTEMDYDVWHFQPRLFVIESFRQLAEEFDRWAGAHRLL